MPKCVRALIVFTYAHAQACCDKVFFCIKQFFTRTLMWMNIIVIINSPFFLTTPYAFNYVVQYNNYCMKYSISPYRSGCTKSVKYLYKYVVLSLTFMYLLLYVLCCIKLLNDQQRLTASFVTRNKICKAIFARQADRATTTTVQYFLIFLRIKPLRLSISGSLLDTWLRG